MGRKRHRADYATELEKNNALFEAYYGALLGEQWEACLTTLKEPLASTFRITGYKSQAEALLEILVGYFLKKLSASSLITKEEELMSKVPFKIDWYPNGYAWQMNASRSDLRKIPELSEFHRFLVSETEIGNMSRQEAVSMIPPLLLDIKPFHAVLDMCAAPGSKSAQLIEALHGSLNLPNGLLVANDADLKRAYVLVHQLRRLQSPCLMVTNHDAQMFPTIYVNRIPLLFDRIICDVPCSGDGTLRKNLNIWKQWTPHDGLALHKVQVKILQRGCRLLKVGGILVYSTCSLNPVENEAVVAEVLKRAQGCIELVDQSDALPLLKRSPGIPSWKVQNKQGEEVSLEGINEKTGGIFVSSHFAHNNEGLNLERCWRIYPHLQNTGGFFVAVLRKVKSINKTDRIRDDTSTPSTVKRIKLETSSTEKERDQEQQEGVGVGEEEEEEEEEEAPNVKSKEEPFVLLKEDDPDLAKIWEFYGIENLPRHLFMIRNEKQKRSIYLISEALRDVLKQGNVEKLNIINAGTKCFIKQDSGSAAEGAEAAFPYRISANAVGLLQGNLRKRVIEVNTETMQLLLEKENPLIKEFQQEGLIKVLEETSGGCCLFNLSSKKIMVPVWRAKVSINLLLAKQEKQSLKFRLERQF